MKLFSKHIVAAYFTPNPQLFSDIFGFPLSELHPDGLLSVRPWHDETIAVMAPNRTSNTKLLFNAIMRETLAQEHKNKLSWQGNCLMLSSSLQSDIHRELGGVTRYVLLPALQDKLKAKAADELESKWRQMGECIPQTTAENPDLQPLGLIQWLMAATMLVLTLHYHSVDCAGRVLSLGAGCCLAQ